MGMTAGQFVRREARPADAALLGAYGLNGRGRKTHEDQCQDPDPEPSSLNVLLHS